MPDDKGQPDDGAAMLLAGCALLAMLTAYVVIPLLAMLGGAASDGLLRAAGGVLGVLTGIVIMLAAARRMSGSWHAAFSLLKIDTFQRRGAWRALWLAPALLLTAGVLTLLWYGLGDFFGWEFSLPPSTQALASGTIGTRLILAGSAILLAPLFEELIFRRAIFGALTLRMKPAPAAVLTALGFAAMHFSLLQLPGIWWLGWNWQRVVQKDGTLWSSVLAHMLNNLISVGMILLLNGTKFSGKFGM